MKCADVGLWRAYLDRQLPPAQIEDLAVHLTDCPSCLATLGEVRQNASTARDALWSLAPNDTALSSDAAALARIRSGLAPVPSDGVLGRVREGLASFAARRLATASVAVLAVLAVMVLAVVVVPPVRTLADDVLQVFRVKKFTTVSVDREAAQVAMRMLPSPDEVGTVSLDSQPQMREVSASEAATILGFPLRVPSAIPGSVEPQPKLGASEGTTATFTVDAAKLRTYLGRLGEGDTAFVDALNGMTVTFQIPAVAVLFYAEQGAASGAEPGLVVVQAESPAVEVPAGVDAEGLRERFLNLRGIPPQMLTQLRSLQNWSETAVLPLPEGATSRDVMVDGVEGVLLADGTMTGVLWQKNGFIYLVAGTLSADEVLQVANSLR